MSAGQFDREPAAVVRRRIPVEREFPPDRGPMPAE